jgi:formyl-CoA transferase
MRMTRTPPRRAQAGPVLGAHTREALREVGYSDGDVDGLVAARTALAAS